jgi:hypothetical protein
MQQQMMDLANGGLVGVQILLLVIMVNWVIVNTVMLDMIVMEAVLLI